MDDCPITVLLAEDKPDESRLIQEMLQSYIAAGSIHLAHAGCLAEALGYLSQQEADAVLLDLSLPDSSGLATLEKIRICARKLPVLVLTEGEDDALAHSALQAGADDSLVKTELNGKLLMRAIGYAIERKGLQEILREDEERYRLLYERSPLGYQSLNADGQIIQINQAWLNTFGYQREEVLGLWFGDILAPGMVDAFRERFPRFKAAGEVHNEFEMKHKDGRILTVAFDGKVGYDEKGNFRQTHCVLHDITTRKRAEALLRESENRFRQIVETASEGVCSLDAEARITYVNSRMAELLGYSIAEMTGRSIFDFIPSREWPHQQDQIASREQGVKGTFERIFLHKSGKEVVTLVSITPILNSETARFTGSFSMVTDITELKRTEDALREREFWLIESQRAAQVGSYRFDILKDEWQSTVVLDEIFGIDANYAKSLISWMELVHPDQRQEMMDYFLNNVVGQKVPFNKEYRIQRPVDRQVRWVHGRGELLFDESGTPVTMLGIIQDITERKNSEENLKRLNERFFMATHATGMGVWDWDIAKNELFWDDGLYRLYGIHKEDFAGAHEAWLQSLHPEDRQRGDEDIQLALRGEKDHDAEFRVVWPDGTVKYLKTYGQVKRDTDGRPLRMIGVDFDITELKLAQEALAKQAQELLQRNQQLIELNQQTETHVQQLVSLRMIDMAISSSFDLKLTLGVLLEQVVKQLGVHFADVLLFNPVTQMLTYAAGQGFRTSAYKFTSLHLGESFAGTAARTLQTVVIPNLLEYTGEISFSPKLLSEGCVTYIGVPLKAKGKVKGVLEIFHRTQLELSQEKSAFLEMLAGQAAIALEIANLFENLQKLNSDLSLTYDNTLAGWATALELRDRESQGHSRHMADLTVELAGALYVPDKDLVHIYRGALLHDIGNMAVPDPILLKSDRLTEEEWAIMRQHPQVAYDILVPIEYLRPALDIPYCHHERWDGTGYPRGLKAEQIPLSARIFAVVDVWDALTSDRPYRKAWPKEKALAYIQEQSGQKFDPMIVPMFLKIIAGR